MSGNGKGSPPPINGKWHGKRYYSLEAFFKNRYGYRLRKISFDAGFTCPNRDGTLDTRGCIFCSEGGSGEFAVPPSFLWHPAGSAPMTPRPDMLPTAKADRFPPVCQEPFVAYFQAYTNTYAPVSRLERLYRSALEHPLAAGISIATRPDCLPEEVLKLLDRLKKDYPEKFLWIELGLQTIHKQTAVYIRRGYPLSCFARAVDALHGLSVPVIVHVILGLPGEDAAMMLQTVEYLNRLPVSGVKLQLLHVLKGTDLAADYEKGCFRTLSMEEYLNILIRCIEHLSPDTVLHRVTGDGARDLLVAPLWSLEKKKVLNALHHRMKVLDAYQGKYQNRKT